MVDKFTGSAGPGADKFPKPGVSDQAAMAARNMKNKVSDLADSSADAMKDKAGDLIDAAKGAASQATDKLRETVDSQKTAGADYVHGLADAMRRAAREFEGDVPVAATYMRRAADQVENVSQSIKNGDVQDLISTAQSFARRQPTAFFGIAALAGFGIVRFLKSSSGNGHMRSAGNHQASSNNRGGGQRQQLGAGNVRYGDEVAI